MNKDALETFVDAEITATFNKYLEEAPEIIRENIANLPEGANELSAAAAISATYANISVQTIKEVLINIVENIDEFK